MQGESAFSTSTSGVHASEVSVLIVDDRPEDLLAMRTLLDGQEYLTICARSGAEALRRLLEHDVALILLDVMMPDMDGFEFASLIRQRERSRLTPIIFLTADSVDLKRAYRAYSVGGIDYLVKPVDSDVLRAKVAVFADLYRKEQRIHRQALALQEAERRERALQVAELQHMAERRYRNLAEAIPEIVWTARPDGQFDYLNRRWSEQTGVSAEQAKGSGWLRAVHPDDIERCASAWRHAVATGQPYSAECRLRQVSGGYRWHWCRAVAECDPDGHVLAWLGTFSDFEELKQAIGARDEFMAIASHELRTPLTALKLRLQSMQRPTLTVADLQEKVVGAIRQAGRLERLIDNLLDVARVTTGRLDLVPEELDLCEVVRQVADRVAADAERVGTRVELALCDACVGWWDRLRLEQILANLLSNAIKYGEGGPIRVELGCDVDSAELTVVGGQPIGEADLGKIFGRFERAGGRRAAGGLGVGLYVTRQIVTAHGGTIEIRSDREVTVVRVSLPRTTLRPEEEGESCDGVAKLPTDAEGLPRSPSAE
ncbi:MAG TPA: response regulator [Polyangiaceae bacterium]